MPKFAFTVYLEADTVEEATQTYDHITANLDVGDFDGGASVDYDGLDEVDEDTED